MLTRPPRIAIVGGGPGGLTLARLLLARGLTATAVFERDAHPLARPQGGTLDLHVDGGQLALAAAGLTTAFRAVARAEDQGSRLYAPDGTLLFDEMESEQHDRPEVDRTALRQLLLDSLPPGVVRWRAKLHAVTPHPDGTYSLILDHGMTAGPFDLVVGADGGRSRVRPLVSPAVPAYTGFTFVDLSLDDVDDRCPGVAALVGRGKLMAYDGTRGLIAQRNGHAHVRAYAALAVPDSWAADNGLGRSDPAAARRALLAFYEGWSPRLLELIGRAGDRIVPWPLYEMPVGHEWPSRPGVTLLGDAAHLMTPFGGSGVNLAMRDALDLADALTAGGDRRIAIAAYERTMCDRAEPEARGAGEALREVMSSDGQAHCLRHLREHGQSRPLHPADQAGASEATPVSTPP